MPLTEDQLAGLLDDADASAPAAPVAPSVDIEKIKAELSADFDARISGFQSKVVAPRDEMIAALRAELDELKNAGLSEEERAQLDDQRKDREIEDLRAQLELKELGASYGEELPFYQRLISAASAEDQLKVLRELRTPVAPSTTADDKPVVPEASDINPNRPMRSNLGSIIRLADGTQMSDEIADRVLGSVDRMRG